MPEEERDVEPTETETEPDEDSSPADDTGGEAEPESEPEDREARSFRHVRDDLYRRQSKLEGTINQLVGMMQGISQGAKPASETRSSDPTMDRLRLQQDPRSLFREVAKDEVQALKSQIAEETRREVRIASAQEELSRSYPELKDGAHPFYEATDRVYKDLLEEGSPEDPRTVLRAARIASREFPELREEKLKARRRVSNGTRPVPPKREPEAPKPPRRAQESPPELTREDRKIFERWGMNFDDEKEREAIRKDRQLLDKRRLYPVQKESDEED